MKEFTFEEVKCMIDNLEPKINEMTIEEFNTMVINDVKIMNHIQKFIPLLDFNCAINLFKSDITIAFNFGMIYGKDGGLLNKVPLFPDDINYLKKELGDEYYSKTRLVTFRVINTSKIIKDYVISIDGNMYDIDDNSTVNTINLDAFTKNRIIKNYMLYHNMLHNWIQSNIYNLDIPKEEKKKDTSGMVILASTTNKDDYIGIFDCCDFIPSNYLKENMERIITNISYVKVDDINIVKEYLMNFGVIDFNPDKAINNFTPINMAENCNIGDIIDYITSKETEINDKYLKLNKKINDVLESIKEVDDEGKLYNVNKVTELINEMHAYSKSCVDEFLDRTSSDKHINKTTKKFNFGMVYKMYGTKTVEVPRDFSLEQAKQYVQEHLDEIDLPYNADYISDSETPDFGLCDFEED